MSILVFDTETTGLPPRGVTDPKAPGLPHVVELGAAVFAVSVNGAFERVRGFSTIIKPDGWEIPEAAAKVHGISTERAAAEGVPAWRALWMFERLIRSAEIVVAHNLDFDLLMINAEFARIGFGSPMIGIDKFCTMKATTPICRIPGRYRDFKWPKLEEAYRHLFGEDFDGAHSAEADLEACARIYAELMRREQEAGAPEEPS